jgi:hypothetical protein
MTRLPLLALILCASVGCGGSGPPTAAVTGKVTCRGEPIKGGAVLFSPMGDDKARESGKPAGADIGQNGEFSLNAPIGKHRVTVTFEDPYKAPCASPEKLVLEVKESGNTFPIELDPTWKK